MKQTPVLVTGLPRTGSSLLMRMLDVGGFPVVGSFPSYEDYLPGQIPWATVGTKAIKVLEAHKETRLPLCPFRVILLDRNRDQQMKSGLKMARAQGFELTDDPKKLAKYRRSLDDDMARLRVWSNKAQAVIKLDFEQLINYGPYSANRLDCFLGGGLDTEAMAQCVRPRSTDCYDGFLEVELLKEAGC